MKISDLKASLVTAANGAHGEMAKVLRERIFRTMGTKTAAAGAATLSALQGKITTEALTTAAAAAYALTLTNDQIAAGDIVLASVAYGTATAGVPVISRVTPAAGSVVIVISNEAGAAALDGTLVVSFVVAKAA